jgi:GNAT superfamily N-acetyltransferase
MDEQRYSVRDYTDSDHAEVAALSNRIFPDRPISEGLLREEWALVRRLPVAPYRVVVEERSSGGVVADGGLDYNPHQLQLDRPWVIVEVDPAHRHRGIGTYLYETSKKEALRRGATGLRARARDEPAEYFAFLERRGFVERRRAWVSVLDLSRAAPRETSEREVALVAQGVRFTTLEEEGAQSEPVLRRLYDLSVATGSDVPRVGAFTAPSFEEFRALDTGGDGFRPAAWMLARIGSEYIGVSYGVHNRADPATLEQSYTAVRREYRGRGVAEALKVRLIAYARANGYRRISTSNDSLNRPMWSLNERLGFRRSSVRIAAECVFAESSRPGPADAGRT